MGLAAMLIFLSINEQPLHAPPAELYRVVMDVAQNRIGEEEVATWLRRQLDG